MLASLEAENIIRETQFAAIFLMPSYTCDDVDNAFLAETGRLGGTLAKRLSPRGKWRNVIPFGEWIDGMGVIHNSVIWERTVPANAGTEWVDMSPSDLTGSHDLNQCDLTPETVKFGQSTRSMRKQARNIRTDWFCVEDFRDDYSITQMLTGVQQNLGWITHYVWENRIQDEYDRLCDHKVTENASFNIEGTSFNAASPPTSKLLNGTLEQIYQWLMADGAGVEGGIGTSEGGHPIFTLFTDMNTDRDLIRQDPELRIDFRYDPSKVGLLTQAFGMERAWNNFKHVFNPFQPRYEIVNGAYVRVQPYKDPEAATKGVKQLLRKEYIYATYAKSYVVVPQVMTVQVPKTITDPGGDFHFDPVNYMGDFAWLNIKDVKCNPRGRKGFFDAIYTSASEPGTTWFGFSILHLNCPPLRTGLDCYEYEKFSIG